MGEIPLLIKTAFLETKNANLFNQKLSVLQCLYRLMQLQTRILGEEKRKGQDLWHSDFFEREIEVKCHRCHTKANPDCVPRWSVRMPGHWLQVDRWCTSDACSLREGKNKQTRTIPWDSNVKSVTSGNEWAKAAQEDHITPYLLPDHLKNDQSLPSEIRTRCSKCDTEAADTAPEFTRGKGNPLYVIKRHKCKGKKKGEGYRIPVVGKIKFIFRQQLRRYMMPFEPYGKVITDNGLRYLPASKTRGKKIRDDLSDTDID